MTAKGVFWGDGTVLDPDFTVVVTVFIHVSNLVEL